MNNREQERMHHVVDLVLDRELNDTRSPWRKRKLTIRINNELGWLPDKLWRMACIEITYQLAHTTQYRSGAPYPGKGSWWKKFGMTCNTI